MGVYLLPCLDSSYTLMDKNILFCYNFIVRLQMSSLLKLAMYMIHILITVIEIFKAGIEIFD
jgi:hypothetical protein